MNGNNVRLWHITFGTLYKDAIAITSTVRRAAWVIKKRLDLLLPVFLFSPYYLFGIS